MNAWTLAFSDAAMEEKYATHTFANSAAVFVDLCALAMAANFLMFVWYLVANESGAVGGAAIVFISCGFGMVITRAVARMQDQKRARVYFGRLNVLSMLVTMSSAEWRAAAGQRPWPSFMQGAAQGDGRRVHANGANRGHRLDLLV